MAILIRRGIIPPASTMPTSSDNEVTAWIAAVYAAGGTVSQTRADVATTLVSGLKSDSVFSRYDRIWILAFADEHAKQAQIDLVNLQSWTQSGSGTLGVGGWTGNGTTGYLDTNVAMSALTQFQQNTNNVHCYIRNNRTTASDMFAYGAIDGSNVVGLRPNIDGTTSAHWATVDVANAASASEASTRGAWITTRLNSGGAGAVAIYKNDNGTALNVDTDASVARPTINCYIGAFNTGGGVQDFSTDQIAAIAFGGSMSSTQAVNFNNRINTCMTSLGVNIY